MSFVTMETVSARHLVQTIHCTHNILDNIMFIPTSTCDFKTRKTLDNFKKKLKNARKSSTSFDGEEEEDTEDSSWWVVCLMHV